MASKAPDQEKGEVVTIKLTEADTQVEQFKIVVQDEFQIVNDSGYPEQAIQAHTNKAEAVGVQPLSRKNANGLPVKSHQVVGVPR